MPDMPDPAASPAEAVVESHAASADWQVLSALADGQADAAQADRLFDAWRNDGALRQRWHAYQLIGDALRSDDLASRPDHDLAFLNAVRSRLATEPVVLAPSPEADLPAAADSDWGRRAPGAFRRRRWAAPAAAAAGFVAVASAMLVMRPAEPVGGAAAGTVATAAPASAVTVATRDVVPSDGGVATRRSTSADTLTTADFVRDPELDRYLAAHRQFNINAPGGLRSVVATRPPGP